MNARTCALCVHCTIKLGSQGYSDRTPAEAGTIECAEQHAEIKQDEGAIDLMRLARVAAECPDFEQMKEPE